MIGVKSLNYGASTGTFTFTGSYTGNALADLLLGYPQSGNVPLNTQLDGYVNYYSGYVQDDWRVNDRLTLNYGLRLEHETGLAEREQPDHGRLRSERGQPAEQQGERSSIRSPGSAARSRAAWSSPASERRADGAGQSAGDQAGAARRRGLQLQREDRAARRLGPLLLRRGTIRRPARRLGPDRLLGDDQRRRSRSGVPTRDDRAIRSRAASCSRSGNSLGLLDRRRRRRLLRRSEQGRAARAAVLGRPAARAAEAA